MCRQIFPIPFWTRIFVQKQLLFIHCSAQNIKKNSTENLNFINGLLNQSLDYSLSDFGMIKKWQKILENVWKHLPTRGPLSDQTIFWGRASQDRTDYHKNHPINTLEAFLCVLFVAVFYQCYYTHTLGDLVSLVCCICIFEKLLLKAKLVQHFKTAKR